MMPPQPLPGPPPPISITAAALRALAYILLVAFVASSLVREQDTLSDVYLFDRAWQLLVALIIVPALYVVIRQRRQFAAQFERYANSFSFGLFAAGFLTTYVFSRLYGRTSKWVAILGDSYARDFKNAAQEVVELLGYTLILAALLELTLLARHWHRAHS
ncbi:MAG: hypothetical protein RQ826_16445 [Xanthomonadales bacterium]|nr:hypothetical protein [Xanthomonadales bacterium]